MNYILVEVLSHCDLSYTIGESDIICELYIIWIAKSLWPVLYCGLSYTISESGSGCELHTIKSAESLCRESLCLYTLGKKVKVCTV